MMSDLQATHSLIERVVGDGLVTGSGSWVTVASVDDG